jgi:hypothetical protein
MRVIQAAAPEASEAGSRHEAVAVAEDVPPHMLLLTGASTLLASELPVEGLQRFPLGLKLVRVPLNELRSELRVHWGKEHCGSLKPAA